MRPYYEAGGVTIYLGDCREVLANLNPADVALLWADPPYGIRAKTRRDDSPNGRGKHKWHGRNFAPVAGDDAPFDPAHLLRFPRLILWGGNHYASRLPDASCWLTWDKRDGSTAGPDQADAELAWTNLGGAARLFRHCWSGFATASESGQPKLHPTQKPVALSTWAFQRWTRPGDLIVSPYLGSGPELRSAKDLGRRIVGVELEERYCEAAARRLSQEVLLLGGAA